MAMPAFPSKIKGLSDARRVPCLGKVRLGIKKRSEKTGNEYPTETPYFVCPAEVVEKLNAKRKAMGLPPYAGTEEITELDIMFPVDDTAAVFPQAYEMYGKGTGLKCIGDGETASRRTVKVKDGQEVMTNDWHDRKCPCEFLKTDENPTGACTAKGHLRVILHDVNMGGVYQIDTGSFNTIMNLNSSFEFTKHLLQGRLAGVPLKLKREPITTHHDGQAQKHYTLRLYVELTAEQLSRYYKGQHYLETFSAPLALPEPIRDNPEDAPVDVYEPGDAIASEVVDVEALAKLLKEAGDESAFYEAQAYIKEREDNLTAEDVAYLHEVARAKWSEVDPDGEKPAPPAEDKKDTPRMASEPQKKMLFAVMKSKNVAEADFKKYIVEELGITSGSTKDLPADKVNVAKAWLEKH